jgi:hypothetical protein
MCDDRLVVFYHAHELILNELLADDSDAVGFWGLPLGLEDGPLGCGEVTLASLEAADASEVAEPCASDRMIKDPARRSTGACKPFNRWCPLLISF